MPETAPALDALLDYLKRVRGFDFTGYKRASLERRIVKRMQAVGVEGFADYLDYLELHPDEFAFLFNTILINVTAFFRDPPAWRGLQDQTLPQLLAAIPGDAPIRVWSAGCASGEEPYTIAMLLAEALGEAEYLERVKVYATDVDEEALNEARHASYDAKKVENVPPELLDRYFDRSEQRYVVRKDLRRTVIFGRNDLVQDAPISRIDLLACRNTLMYFNAETQARILGRFHFALNDRGFMFLGKSEMLVTHSELFRAIDLKGRVFQKAGRSSLRERLASLTNPEIGTTGGPEDPLRDGAFDASPVPQVVVDPGGRLVMANAGARELFHLAAGDVGRPLKDLELSYRPLELRANLDRVHAERRAVLVGGITAAVATGDVRDLEVQLVPVMAPGEEIVGVTVAFHDVTAARRMQEDLEKTKHELETAYEELQSTVEELETTNEELQSTNEELETTNEELQSTNEELETMNEELQSTNEELETMNDELRTRSFQLDEVNGFLETILSSMGVAVVVVDDEQAVRVWNGRATDLWGLRPDEAEGRHLLALDIGLPLEAVKPILAAVLSRGDQRAEVVVDAVNRRGRSVRCRVIAVPMPAEDGRVGGAILLMEELASGMEAAADGAGSAAAGVDG